MGYHAGSPFYEEPVTFKKLSVLIAALALGLAACQRLSSPQEKAGYAVGLSIGQNLKTIQEKVEVSSVYKGYLDQAGIHRRDRSNSVPIRAPGRTRRTAGLR